MLDSAFLQGCEAAALRWDVPALAVGVAIGDNSETAALGCEPATRFRVASITKPVTAALALELLDPGAPTGIWPPDVRIRHLLSHTSGYDGELADVDQASFEDAPDPLAAQLAALASVRRWVGVEQCWSYANSGYWIAGQLAADAAGSSYEAAVATHLLRPLGLDATSFEGPDVPGTGADAGDGLYPRARRPSGGLVSNVPDLLRLGRALVDRPQQRIVHGKPPSGVYGLGLWGERVAGVEVWGHGGSWGGYQGSLLTIPDRGVVFAGLTNSSLGARRRVPETVELPAHSREELTGAYANSSGWYEVAFAVDGLSLKLDDGEFAARAIGGRTFEVTEGEHVRERFDFPLEGFGRFGSRLAERVA